MKRVFFHACLLLLVGMLLPGSVMAANAKRGKRIYGQYCTPCHGQKGDGRGPRAKNEGLQPPPRDHTNGFYMNMQTDKRLFKVIKYGGAANHLSHVMPQWQHILSDKKIYDIIAYLRTIARNPRYEPPKVSNWGKNPYAADEREPLKEDTSNK